MMVHLVNSLGKMFVSMLVLHSLFKGNMRVLTSNLVSSTTPGPIKIISDNMTLPEVMGNRFLYFGYGSNMLFKRITILNKSAVRKDFGKLKDYKLEFFTSSSKWQGAPATIVPKPGESVMGAIYEINLEHMQSLDEQESVPQGIYIPLSLPIEKSNGETVTCRVYRLRNLPEELPKDAPVPMNRQPSHTYLKTIVKGAIETRLPEDYIQFLKSFKHNENLVPELENELELRDFAL